MDLVFYLHNYGTQPFSFCTTFTISDVLSPQYVYTGVNILLSH